LVLQISPLQAASPSLAREARSFADDRDFGPHDCPNDANPHARELTSLVYLAIATPAPKIPAIHLARLVLLGYVLMASDGPPVTGDGLIRITQSG
jgi:hypothetical protein